MFGRCLIEASNGNEQCMIDVDSCVYYYLFGFGLDHLLGLPMLVDVNVEIKSNILYLELGYTVITVYPFILNPN